MFGLTFIFRLDEAKKYRQLDRDTINKLNQQIADLESECNMLRRSLESLETERQRDKTTINRLQQEVDKLRIVRQRSINIFYFILNIRWMGDGGGDGG